MTDTVLSSHVTLSRINQLDVLRIQNNQASATVALQGAHLIEYTPADGDNLLFVSKAETFEQNKAIRGGIPICWPWFGPHTQNTAAPAHGFVREALWDYEVIEDQAERTDIRFTFLTKGTEVGFEYKAKAELLISIGKTLVMSLTTMNLDNKPFSVSQALHSYFNCEDITKVKLHGLTGACYFDKISEQNAYVPTEFQFDREIDWVVRDQGEPIALTGLGQAPFQLNRLGSGSVIVWNPWIEKAKTLSHFLADEYQSMFCVETANASEDARLIKANDKHALVMELNPGPSHEIRKP